MAWNIEVDKVLESWSVQPVPADSNPRLLNYIIVAKSIIDRNFSDIEYRISDEDDLQDLINYVSSMAIQRAWYEDPRNISSRSEGIGAFSKSFSKDTQSFGLKFTSDELLLISPAPDSTSGNGIFATITMGKPNPNFNLESNSSYDDYTPIGENAIYNDEDGTRWTTF